MKRAGKERVGSYIKNIICSFKSDVLYLICVEQSSLGPTLLVDAEVFILREFFSRQLGEGIASDCFYFTIPLDLVKSYIYLK